MTSRRGAYHTDSNATAYRSVTSTCILQNATSFVLMKPIVLILLLTLAGHLPFAQAADQQLKTAFLYHFCSYVQWTASTLSHSAEHEATTPTPVTTNARANITIGVAATRKTTQLIKEALEGKYHGKCNFSVRPVKPDDPLENIQMLYIARNSKFSLDDFSALENDPPILTVTDEEKISSRSIIRFLIRDDHVRFSISKSRADETGLKLSSELLAVALHVN